MEVHRRLKPQQQRRKASQTARGFTVEVVVLHSSSVVARSPGETSDDIRGSVAWVSTKRAGQYHPPADARRSPREVRGYADRPDPGAVRLGAPRPADGCGAGAP